MDTAKWFFSQTPLDTALRIPTITHFPIYLICAVISIDIAVMFSCYCRNRKMQTVRSGINDREPLIRLMLYAFGICLTNLFLVAYQVVVVVVVFNHEYRVYYMYLYFRLFIIIYLKHDWIILSRSSLHDHSTCFLQTHPFLPAHFFHLRFTGFFSILFFHSFSDAHILTHKRNENIFLSAVGNVPLFSFGEKKKIIEKCEKKNNLLMDFY